MKQPKVFLWRTLMAVILVGCVLSFLLILQKLFQNGSKPLTTSVVVPAAHEEEVAKQVEISYGLPVRLKIPKINVDAAIEHTGLTPEGDMQAPGEPGNAGWYKFGSHPGNKGSAVIAGHYGWRNEEAAVFNELYTLNKGNLIYVEDETSTIAVFVVREIRTYAKDEIVPNAFSSSDGKAHLNLITCHGTWVDTQQTYSNRLVVFADKETH